MTCWRQRPRPQRGTARNDRPSGTRALPQPPLEGCRTVHTPWDSGRLGGPALPGQAACGSRAGRSLFPCWFCRLAHPHVDKQQGTVGLSGSSHLSPASPQGRRLDLGRVLSLAACPLDSKGSDLVPKGTVWGNRRLFFFFLFFF